MIPSLPLPLVSALVLGFLLAWLLLRRDRPGLFVAFVGACALQAAVISLAHYDGNSTFRFLQPITAATIPPLAWAALQLSAVRKLRVPHDLVHLAGPVLALTASVTLPPLLDGLIPALFLGYGALILQAAWRAPDDLPRLPFGTGDMPGRTWKVIGLSLVVSAVADTLFVFASMTDRPGWQPWIITALSSLMLLTVGALVLIGSLGRSERDQAPNTSPASHDPEADRALVARLDAVLEVRKLHLDPDLTLARLARVLQVPVKQLSGAINRSTGDNVSRYVNGYRIREACRTLEGGASVTDAMLGSGFNTKSNFNREFRAGDWHDALGLARHRCRGIAGIHQQSRETRRTIASPTRVVSTFIRRVRAAVRHQWTTRRAPAGPAPRPLDRDRASRTRERVRCGTPEAGSAREPNRRGTRRASRDCGPPPTSLRNEAPSGRRAHPRYRSRSGRLQAARTGRRCGATNPGATLRHR